MSESSSGSDLSQVSETEEVPALSDEPDNAPTSHAEYVSVGLQDSEGTLRPVEDLHPEDED